MDSRKPSPRDQLLATAQRLFYTEGINSVGVDRILEEAGSTRATMYRHFHGKEGLVIAYLDLEDATIRGYFAAAEAGGGTPRELLEAVIEGVAQDATRYHTRGCPFINASVEYADPDSPVRQVVARHRAWFRATLGQLTVAAGVPDPEQTAAALVQLRDAMLVGAYLDGPDAVADVFRRAARQIAGL